MIEVKEQCKQCFHFQVCANVLKHQLYIREVIFKEENPKCECFISTEDAVPRSELDKFIQEIDQIQKDKADVTYLKEQLIAKAKQDVAREIFEELGKYQAFFNRDTYCNGHYVYDLQELVAELRKKYIGE